MADLALDNITALIVDGTRFVYQSVTGKGTSYQPPYNDYTITRQMWVASGVPADGGLVISAPIYLPNYLWSNWSSSGSTNYITGAVFKAKQFAYRDGSGQSAQITTLAPHRLSDVSGPKLCINLASYVGAYLFVNGTPQYATHVADWSWNPQTQSYMGTFDVQGLGYPPY